MSSPTVRSPGSQDSGQHPTRAAASVGDLYLFASTEEKHRIEMLGCKQRGLQTDKPFDHKTGIGYVAEKKGDYSDALSRGTQ